MIKLALWIGGSGHGNPDRDLRLLVELTLNTSAPFTPDNAKKDSIGHWLSDSPSLGSERNGDYYVKNAHLPSCPDVQKWIRGCPTPPSNPVGFFFLSKNKEPILILEGFEPMKLKVKDGGDGSLLNAKDNTRKFVDWIVESI